ncbi:MAG: hypothetical protein U5K70_05245 [Halodesulfurarchaeum sp.]|nr:hypothetical protein [Halodesulfurarchaeum sp.]
MVEEQIRDPDRIASLLRAELEGLADPPFDSLAVETRTESRGVGDPAFDVLAGEKLVFAATNQDDRLVLEFRRRPDAVLDAADAAGLPARPKATTPPATVLFVERAAAVKRVIDVLRATHESQ